MWCVTSDVALHSFVGSAVCVSPVCTARSAVTVAHAREQCNRSQPPAAMLRSLRASLRLSGALCDGPPRRCSSACALLPALLRSLPAAPAGHRARLPASFRRAASSGDAVTAEARAAAAQELSASLTEEEEEFEEQEESDRVWLVVTGAGAANLELNRVPLVVAGAGNSCWRHDITPLLGERNELVLTPSGEPAEPGGDRPAGPPPARGHRPLDPRHGTLHLEIIPEDLQSS